MGYVQQANHIAIDLEDPILIGKSYSKIGIAYYQMNQMELSTQNYYSALTIFDSINYELGVAKALNNIAWNYRNQGLLDKSIEYFIRSMEIAEEIENLELLQGIYNNLGTAYRHSGEQQKALKMFNQSLEINQNNKDKKWEAFNLNNIGLAHKDLGNFEKAKKSFLQAKDINLALENRNEYIKNLLNIGSVLTEMGQYDSADLYLEFALPIIDKNGLSEDRFIYFYYKADLYQKMGKYEKALEYYQLAVGIEKKLNILELNEEISKLQAKYSDSEKSRKLVESVQKVNEQRLVIIGGTSLFLLLLGVLFLVLQLYKSKNLWARSVDSLNNEINQKNEELQSVNEEIQSINDKLEVAVQERTRRIKTQNEKLVKYAFINSHEVRGPLARVLGLQYLLGLENKSLRNDESFKMLSGATKELDDVIGDASKLLEDEDLIAESKEINN